MSIDHDYQLWFDSVPDECPPNGCEGEMVVCKFCNQEVCAYCLSDNGGICFDCEDVFCLCGKKFVYEGDVYYCPGYCEYYTSLDRYSA